MNRICGKIFSENILMKKMFSAIGLQLNGFSVCMRIVQRKHIHRKIIQKHLTGRETLRFDRQTDFLLTERRLEAFCESNRGFNR